MTDIENRLDPALHPVALWIAAIAAEAVDCVMIDWDCTNYDNLREALLTWASVIDGQPEGQTWDMIVKAIVDEMEIITERRTA